jgi:hypothetical protein
LNSTLLFIVGIACISLTIMIVHTAKHRAKKGMLELYELKLAEQAPWLSHKDTKAGFI